MVIIQVNDNDLPGCRFNGHDLQLALNEKGHQAYQFVLNKTGDKDTTIPLLSKRLDFLRGNLIEFERHLSMNGLAYSMGRNIMSRQEFQNADIVHYHLIHNYFLSLLDFPELTKTKPSIWTIHDPWAFTGHCVHPQECAGWKTGCKSCPKLHEYFPMRYDKAWQMWKIKKQVYSQLDIDIIVASKFMEKYVKDSPMTKQMERVHTIPFGIKIEDFGLALKTDARKQWNIPNNDFVIAFRAEDSEFKGLKYILQMLKVLDTTQKITLLTVGHSTLPKNLKNRYNLVELGWQDNPKAISLFYTACDVFLMPSIAEAFGLMAVEAMASSRPVVVFEGTALPSVTFAPECGIAVSKGNSNALKDAVERLMVNPDECKNRGEKGRELAEKYYGFEEYVNRHMKLYEEIIKRKKLVVEGVANG